MTDKTDKMTESDFWNWKDSFLASLAPYVDACSAPGPVDNAVAMALRDPAVRLVADQLEGNEDMLVRELREYGAWDAEELQDHEDNLRRMAWIVCCDFKENNR